MMRRRSFSIWRAFSSLRFLAPWLAIPSFYYLWLCLVSVYTKQTSAYSAIIRAEAPNSMLQSNPSKLNALQILPNMYTLNSQSHWDAINKHIEFQNVEFNHLDKITYISLFSYKGSCNITFVVSTKFSGCFQCISGYLLHFQTFLQHYHILCILLLETSY